MRLAWIGFAFVLIGCGKTRIDGAVSMPAQPALVCIEDASAAAAAPMAVETPGPLLVTRGVIEPIATDSNMTSCTEMLGARHGTPPIALHVDGPPRTLFVHAKSRGPIGLATGPGSQRCATGAANTWVRLVVPEATGDVTVEIAEVDFAGERRGQTSPFVAVVSEQDVEPTLEPDERAPLDPSDVRVRWAVSPRPCPAGIEYFTCMSATIELTDAKGALIKKVPLNNGLTGQQGCWPEGTGVHCGGASGRSIITLESAQDGSGKVTALETSESDGYCEPTMDCKSRVTLAMFTIPRGARLVAEPLGTWPPPTRSAK
jgi:hypothetical protein